MFKKLNRTLDYTWLSKNVYYFIFFNCSYMLIHISDEKFFNFLKVFSKNTIVYKRFIFFAQKCGF